MFRCEWYTKRTRCPLPALPFPIFLEDEKGITEEGWFCPRHFKVVRDMLRRKERSYWVFREMRKRIEE